MKIHYEFRGDKIKIVAKCCGQPRWREIDLTKQGELKSGADKDLIEAAFIWWDRLKSHDDNAWREAHIRSPDTAPSPTTSPKRSRLPY